MWVTKSRYFEQRSYRYKSGISYPSWNSHWQRSCWNKNNQTTPTQISFNVPEWMIKMTSVITNGMVLVWVTLLPDIWKVKFRWILRKEKPPSLNLELFSYTPLHLALHAGVRRLTWIGYLSPQGQQREALTADNAHCRRASHGSGSTGGWSILKNVPYQRDSPFYLVDCQASKGGCWNCIQLGCRQECSCNALCTLCHTAPT